MKACIVMFFVFLMSTAVYAQQSADSAYPLKVHVTASRMVEFCDKCNFHQQLDVTIDGKKYQLLSDGTYIRLLHLGDYQARMKKEYSENSYESLRIYEIKFADGKTRTFWVTEEPEQ
jgi:hypothetical protein